MAILLLYNVVNGHQLLCDAHAVPEKYRGTAAYLSQLVAIFLFHFFLTVLYFFFFLCCLSFFFLYHEDNRMSCLYRTLAQKVLFAILLFTMMLNHCPCGMLMSYSYSTNSLASKVNIMFLCAVVL